MEPFPHSATLLALCLLGLSGCDSVGITGDCENEVAQTVASPTGRLEVVVFNRGCGATTGFNTQVSIVQAGHLPDGPGNVLLMDGTVPLKVTWQSDTDLRLSGIGSARLFKQEPVVVGVSVAYVR
jgi:hypothetical protein